MWSSKLILFGSLLAFSVGEPIPVALPGLIGPRCANHTDTLSPLTDSTGGPTAYPTGSGIFPTSPVSTGSGTTGSNTTVGPRGPSGSGFLSTTYLYSIANVSTPTAGSNLGRTGFAVGSYSGGFPLPTTNTSIGGTGGPSSGSSLTVTSPSILKFTGTAIRPTAPILTDGTSGGGFGSRGTGPGGRASTPSPDPFGNSSSVGPFPTGSVTVTAVSSNDNYNYHLPPISSGTGVASASSLVASSNSSVTRITSTVNGSFTLTSTIDPSLLLGSGSPPGPRGSNITTPTGVGNSSSSGASPVTGPSTASLSLVPYYPFVPLTSSPTASGTGPVGTGVPKTTSTGIGGPFNTSSASVTDGSDRPASDPTVVPSVSDPTNLPPAPTFPGLIRGSNGLVPLNATGTFSIFGSGGSLFIPTTFGTSTKTTETIETTETTGTISPDIVPTESFHHQRRPPGYGDADYYGYDYDYDYDFEFEDDYGYE